MVTLSPSDATLLGIPTAWTNNWTRESREIYAELMHVPTRGIWLSVAPMTFAELTSLVLPEDWRPSGAGRTEHDAAVFLRSPGGREDGPLRQVVVCGERFVHVAQPGTRDRGVPDAVVMDVLKYHRVLYRQGRRVAALRDSEGCIYILQVSDAERPSGRVADGARCPQGWTRHLIELDDVWVCDVPAPARIVSLGSGEIFHGPIDLGGRALAPVAH